MNAKVGIFDSPKRRKTSWPSFPIANAWLRSFKNESAERSAPAAKINVLPVIAIAAGALATAFNILTPEASLKLANELPDVEFEGIRVY